jgi:two-component system, response regulator, stage 0 sporulation protein F
VSKILVVDDEKEIRRLLVDQLQHDGFVVLEAADGDEALECVRNSRPDLVVLDIGLPRKDGIEVLRRIRQEDPGIGVIMITGRSESVAAQALETGALGYFLKPFDLARLSQAARASVELYKSSSDRQWAAISVSPMKDSVAVSVQGSLDSIDAERMKRLLDNLIDDGWAKLVVDLAGVTYVDSSGLGAIVGGMRRARAAGGDLRLCGLQGDVQSVFEMTGLASQIEVHASQDAAVASWAGPGSERSRQSAG